MGEIRKPTKKELAKYIEENIDRAIENGWIVVYYQPVVRTLTGEVCGMEALARWIDPEYGLLAPDVFIGTLEESRQIHKLDSFMIRKICEDYDEKIRAGLPTVTVSFNLSRLDFHLCDIHSVIEESIAKFRVPREAVRIEITESTMETDEERMHDVIDKFVEKGLRVWMDDFGSGYSSLNVLKDYNFDTLKIDMVFLRKFDQRSKEIVKAIVDMAKRIGVHTLAEGVETKEHLDFLKSIGCEKAQGYYISKPLPKGECRNYLFSKGYKFEANNKRAYFHEIGKINLLSGAERQLPLSILEYDGEKARFMYANEGFMSTLLSLGMLSLSELEEEFEQGKTPLREKFESLLYKTEISNDAVTLSFMRNENFCYVKVSKIAEYAEGKAYLCSLQNLSADTLMSKNTKLSDITQDIIMIYERIELCDLDTGHIEWIVNNYQAKRNYEKIDLYESIQIFADEEIYREDRERYLEFADIDTIEERLQSSPTRSVSAPFRTHTTAGTYSWMLHTILYAGDLNQRKILFLYRKISNETIAMVHRDYIDVNSVPDPDKQNVISEEELWNTLKNSDAAAFFWKDTDRRFVGVSRPFLNYYGLRSEDELIGKTDEDMGWHVDPDKYKSDEEAVLKYGEQTYMVPGTCLCNGEIREILASKIPIYRDGEIIGLLGYFVDLTERKREDVKLKKVSSRDEKIGTLNFLGIVESLMQYRDAYELKGLDFAMFLFDIDRFRNFNRDYGIEWGNKLLAEVAKKIQEVLGVSGVCGRLSGGNFLVVRQFEKKSELKAFPDTIQKAVSEIREVEGIPCTVYFNHGQSIYSEARDLQRLFFFAEESLSTNKHKRR
ncbi:MAG: EAL domain-containing protein [Lachnospiraceae bacterium]|nr:EAL domain-containing protein [Lachnospiraceae bacterium]